MIRKGYRNIIEQMGWTIRQYDDGSVDLCQYSPEGEDFFFCISTKKNDADIAMQVFQYSEDFDADEHAEMWVEARHRDKTVPQSIRTLIDDADAIQSMLSALADALLKEKWRCEDEANKRRQGVAQRVGQQ